MIKGVDPTHFPVLKQDFTFVNIGIGIFEIGSLSSFTSDQPVQIGSNFVFATFLTDVALFALSFKNLK